MADAGWHFDPSGRHEFRYWDGTGWTDHVSDNGAQSTDPLPAAVVEEVGQSTSGELQEERTAEQLQEERTPEQLQEERTAEQLQEERAAEQLQEETTEERLSRKDRKRAEKE